MIIIGGLKLMDARQKRIFRRALAQNKRAAARHQPDDGHVFAIFDDAPYRNHGRGLYSPCVRETLRSRADVRRLKSQGFAQD